MTLEKIARFAGDFRTIWLVIATVGGAAVWAADQRYARKDDVHQAVQQMQEIQIRSRLKELQIKVELGKATEYDRALLRMYEQELQLLKGGDK